MSIITTFPGIERSVVYRFCFLPFLDLFFMKLTTIFSAVLSLCRFGDHVLLFSGSTAMMLVFQASYSQISCDFFFTPPTDPKPGEETCIFDTKRTKRGWPQLSLIVSSCFVLVFLSVGEINWNWHCLNTLYIPFGDSQVRIKKSEKGEDLLTATALGWG